MMEIDTGKFPEVIALIISKIFILLGKGDSFLFGQGKFSSEPNFEDSGTSCKEKFYKHHYELINNVELQRGGGSFRWLNEAIKATKELKKQNNASKVSIPVLLFQAEIDTFVKPRGHYIFAKYAKQCNIELIKNAKHQIYFENDSIVEEYLRKIFDFLNK